MTMIRVPYLKPFGTSLFSRRCYAVTSTFLRNAVNTTGNSSNRKTNEIARSWYRRQREAATFSSQNVVDGKDINLRTNVMVNFETGHDVELPQYLRRHYWWAYINPIMISILDRKWLVDIVLWGNFTKLRDSAIHELIDTTPQITENRETLVRSTCGTKIQGKVLQISSVYADLTEKIVEKLAPDATLDVIDVVPAQLINLQCKLQRCIAVSNDDSKNVSLSCCDASDLSAHFPNNHTFDKVLIFFLLHETPDVVRQQVFTEAFRVVKPDGKIVIIDYHKPNTAFWYYVMQLMYNIYEPFAIDLWKHPLTHWLPCCTYNKKMSHRNETYFGGLYQKLVISMGGQ